MNRGWQGVGRAVALAMLLSWVFAQPFAARAYSPIPEYPGVSGVAVSDAAFDAEALRASLSAFQSQIGAKYAVLVVEYTDRQNRPGPDFGDDDQQFIGSVVNAWGPALDRQSSVLVVLGLSNHDVIVHPFSRFAALGWEQEAVKTTIDGSPFAMLARSGDYTQAILALVAAIDAELVLRQARVENLRVGATRTIASARLSLARFQQAEVGSPFAGARTHALGDALLAKIRAAEGALARSEVDRLPALVRELAVKAAELDGYFTFEAEYMARGERGVVERRREQRRLTNHPRAQDDDVARRRLAEAGASIDRARAALRGFDPARAARQLESAERSQRAAEVAEYRASYRRRITHEVLPIVALVVAFAYAVRRLVLRRGQTRAVVEQARQKLAALDAALGVASEKLLALENEHALFLSGGSAPTDFEGASAGPIREAAARTDELFLAFEAATRLSREARAKLDSGGAIGLSSAEGALAALTTEPFVVRTEQVKERKLLLPDAREIRMTLPELLVELEAAYARASGLLEGLGSRIGQIHADVDTLAALVTRAEDAFESAARKVKIGSFEARLSALDDERISIVTASKLDPLSVPARVEAFRTSAGVLASLAESIANAAELAATRVPGMLDASAARVATLRSGGRRVVEPGFDPDALIATSRLACRAALRALENGELEKAVQDASRAERVARELEECIEASELARSSLASDVAKGRARRDALDARLGERRSRVEALRAEYSDDSLGDVLDNGDEARAALDRARDRLVDAEASGRDSNQAYLGAKRAIEAASDALDTVEALFTAIEGKATELAGALAASDEDRELATALLEAARDESKSIVALGATAPADLAAIGAELRALEDLRAESPKPVRALVSRASAILDRAEDARGLVATRFAAIEKLRAERDRVGELVRALGLALAGSTDDGAEANAAFEEARSRFEDVRDAPLDEMGLTFEAELRSIAEKVESARSTASQDYEQAVEARRAVARAQEMVRDAASRVHATDAPRFEAIRAELPELQRELEARMFATAKRHAMDVQLRVTTLEETISRQTIVVRQRLSRGQRSEVERDAWHTHASERRAARRSIFDSSDRSTSSSSSWGGSSHSSSSHSHHHSTSSSSSSGSSSYGSSSGSSSYGSSSGHSKW